MADIQTLITKNGFTMLAKALAGQQLCFTRVAIGDSVKSGSTYSPTDNEILNLTALYREKKTLPIADVTAQNNGTAIVKAFLDNTTLSTGFFLREIGVFAKIGSGTEQLYAYRNLGEYTKYIPGGGGSELWQVFLNIVTVIDQATNITATIDGSSLFVTQAELTRHINNTKPHPNTPQLAAEITSSPSFWATGSDVQLHPISADNLTVQILGDAKLQIPKLDSRISQNEINIANLFMQLDAEKEGGLDANLLLAEDFEDCKAIDQSKFKIKDEVAGVNNVCVEDFNGILEGHWYTISDGVRSEYVQVKAVAKNESAFVVTFNSNLAKTYKLAKAYLYRSTGLKVGKSMGGAGDIRSTIINFTDTWKGVSSAADATLTLATNQKNAKNFTVSGDGAFTTDGYFTMN